MTLVVLFLGSLVLGAVAEQGWHRLRDQGVARSTPAGPGESPVRTKRRWRRIVLSVLGGFIVLVMAASVAGYFYAKGQFDKIEKVPVGDELAGGSGATNYLLVGTDNRPEVQGNRSDTMLVLRIDGPNSTIMSLPRDLLVTIPGREGEHRLNTAYDDGPAALLRTVQQSLQVPIDRYVEINYVSFAGVVDSLGGIAIDFPFPVTDQRSGLNIPRAGRQVLDGEQALAYVRSREYIEIKDGGPVKDVTADLGRVQRQQIFLRAVLGKAGESRSPFKLAKIGRALRHGLKVDDGMTLLDAVRFAWNMGRLDPETVVLPTELTRSGQASVLVMQEPGASVALNRFRA